MISRIFLMIGLVSITLQVSIAGEPIDTSRNLQGMINGVHYALTQEGMSFEAEATRSNRQMAITWENVEREMAVYREGNQVIYEHIYPNIDLIVSAKEGAPFTEVVYEFVVFPGGNPHDIQLGGSGFRMLSPFAYQDDAMNGAVAIEASFADNGVNREMQTGSYEQAQVLTIRYTPTE